MKKTISILITLIILFLITEWGITFFKKGHEVTYKVYQEDTIFEITEIYQKENGNIYDIKIKVEDAEFQYIIKNNYNKQKKIIKNIEYFVENNNKCIYPVLENDEGTYLQCIKDNRLYTSSSYYNQNFISQIQQILSEKGYQLSKFSDNTTEQYLNSTIYTNNLINSDYITLWMYKGINIINPLKKDNITILSFDKYENKHGYLVNNYYIIPNYLSSRVLEFSSVSIINLENKKIEKLELNQTLSSNTYINGIVENKFYYTDPSNLLQIEINPEKKHVRLIGSKELGGTLYNGNWENVNIYDFKNNNILFQKEMPSINYSYKEIIEGDSSYYFYNNSGEVYQLSKNNLTNPILLFKTNNINNFNIIKDTVYYVSDDTLYYFNNKDGIIPVLKNNELRYNTTNRISIYRKS